ncbi:unnamed protein product [Lactuca virosa]|uniref:Uncharacterized protein n=1 Tax=Lactuca virosa TaxID=75947 RepID=A0AAU9MW77_9ASTR|nr:unnamed protein product [Lactuca virosa]
MSVVEIHDSLFTVSVRQKLSDKLQPVFVMLNQIQGVSKSGASPAQGGDKDQQLKFETDQRDNVASGFGKDKDKGKGILEDDADENQQMTEEERISMEKWDEELDDLQALWKKL